MAKNKGMLPSEELGLFCDQVAMVLKAGIPLHDAFESLCKNYAGTPYGENFAQVNRALCEKGVLHEALREAGIFPDYLCGMVQVGEIAGRLDNVMEALALYYAREAAIRQGIKSAVTYPLVLILLMAAVIAVLLISVMPVFSQVYASLGIDLFSNAAAGTGIALGKTVLGIVAALILLLLLLLALMRTSARGQTMRALDRLVPQVAQANRALFASRFASVVSTMLLSGCDLDQAVEMVGQVVSDAAGKNTAQRCANSLRAGNGFYKAVHSEGIYEPIHEKMLAVGAQSGKLDTVMARLATLYEQKADHAIQSLVASIEPVLVVLLCVAIGGILLSVMLPLLSIMAGMV